MGERKIKTLEEISRIVPRLKKQGKKVIFAHGVFDLIHRGHITLLAEAKKRGDILVVGVDSDATVRRLKGKGRPFHSQEDRAYVVSNLESADYVFIIGDWKKGQDPGDFYRSLYKKIGPAALATSLKSGPHGILKKRDAEALGIEFFDTKRAHHHVGTSRVAKALGLEV